MVPNISEKPTKGTSLRLETLIRLRWAAIFGQIAAVTIVHFGFGFELKFVWCVAVILFSVWLNIFLSIKFKANYRIKGGAAAFLLAYDILQLSALLYLTGGLQNPFALFLLAPTTIAAGVLLLPHLLALMSFAVICASLLVFYYFPLPWKPGEILEFSKLYIGGVWGALLIGMAFFGVFVWRVAEERRQMNEALIASEMVLAREQKLSALDGMAAAMAHELGTPLSTISIAAKDMVKDIKKYPDISDDIELIYSQSQKCREVLSAIGREKRGDLAFAKMSMEMLISEVTEAYQNSKIQIKIMIKPQEKQGRKVKSEIPVIERNPAIIYGLGNIVSNAVKHAEKYVSIYASSTEKEIILVVEDDGPGFDAEIIEYLGEPYISTLRNKKQFSKSIQNDEGGMGLGLFIAKTFLERNTAKLKFSNIPKPGRGARVEIVWEKGVL